jgi:hypothetical protein
MSSIIDSLVDFPNILLYVTTFLSCFDIKKISHLLNKNISNKFKNINPNCCCIFIYGDDFNAIINQFANNPKKRHYTCFDKFLKSEYAEIFKFYNDCATCFIKPENNLESYYDNIFDVLDLLIKNKFNGDMISFNTISINEIKKMFKCNKKFIPQFIINYAYFNKKFDIVVKYNKFCEDNFHQHVITFNNIIEKIMKYLELNYCNVGKIFINDMLKFYNYGNDVFEIGEILKLIKHINYYLDTINKNNLNDLNHIVGFFDYNFDIEIGRPLFI